MEGLGVPADTDLGTKYYEQAIEKGDTGAMLDLGLYYYNGKQLKQDYAKTVRYYQMASDAGDMKGRAYLGKMYQLGKGVKKDLGKAHSYYMDAAKGGNAEAMLFLGQMYENGIGVEKDYPSAQWLYEQAIKLGKNDCQKDLERVNEMIKQAKNQPAGLLSAEDAAKLQAIKEGLVNFWNSTTPEHWYAMADTLGEFSDLASDLGEDGIANKTKVAEFASEVAGIIKEATTNK